MRTHISDIAWPRLGVEIKKLPGIAGNREAFFSNSLRPA